MTVPDPYTAPRPQRADAPIPPMLRAAIWVAIGALIASAIVCVVWVLVGDQTDIVGKAFLTILLLVAFAGATILDAHLAPRRPAWFALASMGAWILLLLIGAVMIWMPERTSWGGFTRFVQFLFIVLIVQLALLHVRLYMKALHRYDTVFTRTVAVITIVLVIALVVLLALPLMLSEYLRFPGIYWRVVVAVAILAAVGTALLPLVNVLFAPRAPRAAAPGFGAGAAGQGATQELLPWPNYVDGITPLPMLPDGSPDWNAYYTGYPSPGAHVFATPEHGHTAASQAHPAASQALPPAAPEHSAPGYEGYPPPPPLPPRP